MAYKRQRLAEMRRAAGYTQEALAEALGVERSTVVRWERAETQPQPWHRPQLCRLLGISAEVLVEVLADVVPSGRPRPSEARAADERSLGALAIYQVGCAFLKNPTSYAQAEALAVTTADDLAASPLHNAAHLSAQGSLLLLVVLC